ncbi:24281_t:CDS:2 [Cetraspora pellucida]|uniref:24281_t:CDS:1 n=1 Tax=Cetraspora pellucida TaxID=1433469 RepID=A0A9N9D1V7_9GLOM|nr:24281_t:CDS:2 [Cetraspora pellucida]
MYKTTLNALLETCINEFEIENMLTEIAKQVLVDCNILSPNIIILKPDNFPNSTKLLSAFDDLNIATHFLFEDASEISEKKDASTSYQTLSSFEINLLKQTHCAATKVEKDILVELFKVIEGMPEAVIPTVILKLQTISSDSD